MTVRDFTEETKARLIEDIKDAEDETASIWVFGGFFDFVSDLFIDENIEHYGEDIERYHNEILDKKNTTLAKLNTIWANVQDTDAAHKQKFQDLKDEAAVLVNEYAALIHVLNPKPADGGVMLLNRSFNELGVFLNENLGTERENDLRMQAELFALLEEERFSKDTWDTLTLAQREALLEELLVEVQRITGVDIRADINFDNVKKPDTAGWYSHSDRQLSINPDMLMQEDGYDRLTTIFHESRHAYQYESVDNPAAHIISAPTREAWAENFVPGTIDTSTGVITPGNYRDGTQDADEQRLGITDDRAAYVQQPVEWDAMSFAGQDWYLKDYTPVYAGSWG